ncbi:MAG: peptide-methionine (R)-S-oxide reductase MsrB [Rubrivivax sp.]
MTRRNLLAFFSALGLVRGASAANEAVKPQATAKAPMALELSDAEWKKRLSPAAYQVLRKEGTERAGSSPLDREKRKGTYQCAGCALPLFTSEMKFDSGTGWPSFYTMLPEALGTSTDFKMILPRTEYHCARCSGHQGHIFDDGPQPTGKRYCNNGVALQFVAATA